jgi:hypothetical protein
LWVLESIPCLGGSPDFAWFFFFKVMFFYPFFNSIIFFQFAYHFFFQFHSLPFFNLWNYKYFLISPSMIFLYFKFGSYSFNCYLFSLDSFFKLFFFQISSFLGFFLSNFIPIFSSLLFFCFCKFFLIIFFHWFHHLKINLLIIDLLGWIRV